MGQCVIDDCGYPTRWRDLCNAHAVRLHLTGVRGGPVVRRGPKKIRSCEVDGCDRAHYCGGYCTRHYQQIRKRGQIEPPRITGPDHAAWRGDQISYRTAHNRVESERGSAREHACADCGGPARHWSYNHDDPDERLGIPRRSAALAAYSLDPVRYSPRCVPCHKRFDLDRDNASSVSM